MNARNTLVSLVASALCLSATSAVADDGHHNRPYHPANVSLGLAVGDPTAFDIKFWTGNHSGFDLGVGFRRFSERLGIYFEYEFGLVPFWVGSSVHGVFYVGIGGAVSLRHKRDDLALAVIVPIGVNFRFDAPLELFLEARPGIEVLDSNGFGIGGQLGIRFYF